MVVSGGRVARAVFCALVMVAVGGPGGAARADHAVNTWYDELGVAQARAEGITGEGVPVAVVQVGISPNLPVLSGAHVTVHEPSFCYIPERLELEAEVGTPIPDFPVDIPATFDEETYGTYIGTNMVAFLVGNGKGPAGHMMAPGVAPGADVRFYATGDPTASSQIGSRCGVHREAEEAEARAIVQAVDDGARVIVLTEGYQRPDARISEAVAYAMHENVILVAAAEGEDSPSWLSRLNGVVRVNWAWHDPEPRTTVQVYPMGKDNDVVMQGDFFDMGSWGKISFAAGGASQPQAAVVAGILADVAQKWPSATNNQLIQTLIRNTGADDHDLSYDPEQGYGSADLLHMLRVDPTGYADENPLIVPDDGEELGLTAADIAGAERPAWADDVQPRILTPAPPPVPEGGSGLSGAWWVVAGVAVLLVGVAVVVVARLRVRARRADGSEEQKDQGTNTTE